jgi:hypothetical protein
MMHSLVELTFKRNLHELYEELNNVFGHGNSSALVTNTMNLVEIDLTINLPSLLVKLIASC